MFINDRVYPCFVKKIRNENRNDSALSCLSWQDSDTEKEQAAALRANRSSAEVLTAKNRWLLVKTQHSKFEWWICNIHMDLSESKKNVVYRYTL